MITSPQSTSTLPMELDLDASPSARRRDQIEQDSIFPKKATPTGVQIVGEEYDEPEPEPPPRPELSVASGHRSPLPAISRTQANHLFQHKSSFRSPSNASIIPNPGDDNSSVNAPIKSASEGEVVTNDFGSIRLHDPASPSSSKPDATGSRRPVHQKRTLDSIPPEADERAAKIQSRSRTGPGQNLRRGLRSTTQLRSHHDPAVEHPRPPSIRSPNSPLAQHSEASLEHSQPENRPLRTLEDNLEQKFSPLTGMPTHTRLTKQPVTTPITQEQLINEVKGIYAGLVMVEKKCVEIDQQQASSPTKLSPEQYQALIALHRTLLHEHHDFFLASQHPSASYQLKKLATKYAMPARMWRHGIHSFLELLRHRLPDSLEYMLLFVYLSYSMMALLMESVPSFEETWIECLGDLARYRMAIEDSDIKEREIWADVAKMWYNLAADRNPDVGRIQHHLAVLSRPNIVQQLFYYSKALVTINPFQNARESIMLLFNPFLESDETASQKYQLVEASFVKANGILFVRGDPEVYKGLVEGIEAVLGPYLARIGPRFVDQGPEFASSICAAIFEFGREESYLARLFAEQGAKKTGSSRLVVHGHESKNPQQKDNAMEKVPQRPSAQASVENNSGPSQLKCNYSDSYDDGLPPRECGPADIPKHALFMMSVFTDVVFSQTTDVESLCNICGFGHVILAFLWSLAFVPGALEYVQSSIPWSKIVIFLNEIHKLGGVTVEGPELGQAGLARQVPEDFIMRGLLWSQHYYPKEYFLRPKPEEERSLKMSSHKIYRAGRCLWLGMRLSSLHHCLHYDPVSRKFSMTDFGKSMSQLSRKSRDCQLATEKVDTNANNNG